MDGKICDKEELEILLVALIDFRIKNLSYKLYQDKKIKKLISKIKIKHEECEEIEVIE